MQCWDKFSKNYINKIKDFDITMWPLTRLIEEKQFQIAPIITFPGRRLMHNFISLGEIAQHSIK